MNTLSIIQICISVLSAIGVLGTLSFTIYFQIKNKKDNKYLDIARLLDYAFEKYKIFEYKYFEKNKYWTKELKIIDNETKWIQGFKDIEIRNNPKELLNQFIEHYSNYLYEISFLISRYEITDFFYCHYCKNKYKQEEWFIFLKNLKSGEQWVWNLSNRVFYDKSIKKIGSVPILSIIFKFVLKL